MKVICPRCQQEKKPFLLVTIDIPGDDRELRGLCWTHRLRILGKQADASEERFQADASEERFLTTKGYGNRPVLELLDERVPKPTGQQHGEDFSTSLWLWNSPSHKPLLVAVRADRPSLVERMRNLFVGESSQVAVMLDPRPRRTTIRDRGPVAGTAPGGAPAEQRPAAPEPRWRLAANRFPNWSKFPPRGPKETIE